MGMSHLSRDELIDWLERSCTEQGVPLLLADESALEDVATLLLRAGS